MSKFELRIFVYKSGREELQYRTKTRWYDGSTTRNGRRDWTEWKEVPKVFENET